MPHDVCRLATILLFVAASRLFGADGPPIAVAPAPASEPCSEVLCGRTGKDLARAEALDALDANIVPEAWRESTIQELRRWADAPRCAKADPNESLKFNRRRKALARLLEWIDEERVAREVRASLMALAKKQPSSNERSKADDWPSSTECSGCEELRRAATTALETAREWRKHEASGNSVGAKLDALREDKTFIAALCKARPSPTAAEEVTRRFRYYSWTASGAWLLDVATWFAQPDVAGTCE
jgi:hypothetical protein